MLGPISTCPKSLSKGKQMLFVLFIFLVYLFHNCEPGKDTGKTRCGKRPAGSLGFATRVCDPKVRDS